MGMLKDAWSGMKDAFSLTEEVVNTNSDNELVAGTVGGMTGAATAYVASGGNPLAALGGAAVGTYQGVENAKFEQEETKAARDAQNVLNSLTAANNSLIDPRKFNVQQSATQPTLIG